MDKATVLKHLTESSLDYAIKIAYALVILFIGWIVARLLAKGIARLLKLRSIDTTIVKFVQRISFSLFIIFVIIAALSKLGVQTASLIAVLGALGLAIGLSLKNSLSNLASGILLIIFRPFKVGDFIQIDSVSGTVDEILILFTRIITSQKQHIIIPNNKFQSDILTNFSVEVTRRADLIVGIGYDDDIDKAREVITQVLQQDERILADPACNIFVSELADSSVNIAIRFFTKQSDHFQVKCDINEALKKRFDHEGISFPFPQQDVHLFKDASP